MGLQERNERLFFRVLLENTQELLPIVDLPAVGAYCKSHGLMFRQPPRGLYIGLRDKGSVLQAQTCGLPSPLASTCHRL